jgi:acetate kinase
MNVITQFPSGGYHCFYSFNTYDNTMNILVLNCGSSSLKFQIIQTDLEMIEKDADKQLAKGLIERIGSQALVSLQASGKSPVKHAAPLRDHRAALDHVIKWIVSADAQIPGIQSLADIHTVGHRVVHGAERFTKSTISRRTDSWYPIVS